MRRARAPDNMYKIYIDIYIQRYEKLLNNLPIETKDIITGSDQNFDYLKIDHQTNTCTLLHVLDNFLTSGLIPMINKPTRIVHTTATLIDNIYTNINITQHRNRKAPILFTDISDHYPVIITYADNKNLPENKRPLTINTRQLDDTKLRNINQSLQENNWESITPSNSHELNHCFQTCIDKMQQIVNQHAPENEIKIKPKEIIRNPWITPGLLKSSKTLDKLYMKQKDKHPDHPSKTKFKQYKTQYNKIKMRSRIDYYENLIQNVKHDVRNTWKILNKLTGKSKDKSTITNNFINNGKVINDPKIISNDLCDYLSHVGEKFASAIPPSSKSNKKNSWEQFQCSFVLLHTNRYRGNVNCNK